MSHAPLIHRSSFIVHRSSFLLLLLQFAWLAATRLFQQPVLIDDAYIHFRNALNWANGHGLVYNIGENVLATTSPVYTIILGLLYKITGVDFPLLAGVFNFVCEIGIMLLSLALLRRAGVPLLFRHAIVAITSFEVWRMIYSRSGMEMSLFLLVTLAILVLIQTVLSRDRGRPRPQSSIFYPHSAIPLCGSLGVLRGSLCNCILHSAYRISHSAFLICAALLLSLLGWIRPEGSVVWIALAIALAATRRWRVLFTVFGLAGLLAAGIAALLFYQYHSFVPQSVHAKALAPWFWGSNGYPPQQFAITLGDLTPFCLFTGFRASWGRPADIFNSFAVMFGQLAFMGFGAGWLWGVARASSPVMHGSPRRFLAVFLSLFVLGYYLFHAILATCIFDWYYVPYYFFAQLLAILGWWAIVRTIMRRLGRRRPALGRMFYRLATPALVALYFVSSAWMGMAGYHLDGDTLAQAMRFRFVPPEPGAREVEYIEIAKLFNKLVPQGSPVQVGCMEIGIFGYYFHGRVLDAFGLVSPEALEVLRPEVLDSLPPSCRKFAFNVFMHHRPQYIMTSPIFFYDEPSEFFDVYELLPREDNGDGLVCYRLKAVRGR